VGPLWRIIVPALAVLAGVSLTACESSQDKAKKIQEQAQASAPKPLTIPRPNKDIKVTGTTVLHDQNGDAVVVELQNNSKETLVNVPVLVDVRDAKGKSIFENNAPGLDPALNHVPVIKPGETFTWVNDQLQPNGIPKSAKVTVGQPEGKAPAKLPELEVSQPRERSSNLGAQVTGTVTNKSQVDQRKLVLFAVARSGGRVVAAGRGLVKKAKVGASPASYVIFFIGDPAGGDVSIEAPPTTLQAAGAQ
jgi:hypothetical protein